MRVFSGLTQRLLEAETGDSSKVGAVAGEKRQIVAESNTGNQAVCHADGLPAAVQVPSQVGGSLGGRSIEGEDGQRVHEVSHRLATPPGIGSAEEFEAGDGGRPQAVGGDGAGDLLPDRVDAGEVVDQDVGVGENQRQFSLSF